MAKPTSKTALVGILMGSDSDLPEMAECARVLEELEIPYEIRVLSAHRTPKVTGEYARTAVERGLKLIVCGAGKAAHLAGVVASETLLPVIGVPMKTSLSGGLDSLLSMVQMPAGIPVATVGVSGAKNAGILAAQILALTSPKIAARFKKYREAMTREVLEKDAKLQELGMEACLAGKKSS